jgi:hypothetical protein
MSCPNSLYGLVLKREGGSEKVRCELCGESEDPTKLLRQHTLQTPRIPIRWQLYGEGRKRGHCELSGRGEGRVYAQLDEGKLDA